MVFPALRFIFTPPPSPLPVDEEGQRTRVCMSPPCQRGGDLGVGSIFHCCVILGLKSQ